MVLGSRVIVEVSVIIIIIIIITMNQQQIARRTSVSTDSRQSRDIIHWTIYRVIIIIIIIIITIFQQQIALLNVILAPQYISNNRHHYGPYSSSSLSPLQCTINSRHLATDSTTECRLSSSIHQ